MLICSAAAAKDMEVQCWQALKHVLLDQVLGVDPDCYDAGEHCVKKHLKDVESIAGTLMPSIKVSDEMDLSWHFMEDDMLISYVERNGETSVFLKTTNPKAGVMRVAAKMIASRLAGIPAGEGVTSVIFKDAGGVEEAFPL